MCAFIILILALAEVAQASAEQRSDKILIQGNAAGTQTVQTDALRVPQAVNIPTTIADAGITSPRPGISTLPECRRIVDPFGIAQDRFLDLTSSETSV